MRLSLQETYAPRSLCFGCGPANSQGLRLRSFVQADAVVADWQAAPQHQAFAGYLNGGIIGTLLDCHANWAAAWHLLQRAGGGDLPSTVTADYHVHFLRPTPAGTVHLSARVVEAGDRRVTVAAELLAEGEVCATSRATFVAVGPGHPAYGRWRAEGPLAGPGG